MTYQLPSRIRSRWLVATAVAAVSALTVSACSSSAAGAGHDGGAKGGFTLHVGIVSKVAPDGVIGWGQQQGILQKDLAAAGVSKVELSTFATGPTLNAALTSGSVDVASQGDTPALTLRSNGFQSKVVAISGIRSNYYLIGKKGGVTKLADLVGKKVSAAPGTAPEQYLIGLLKQAGLSNKIKISNLQTNDAASALRAGQIDAFVASGTMAGQFIAQGFPVIDKASDHTGLYTSSVNIAAQKFLKAHPLFAAAWAEAFADTVKDIKADPDAYWAFNAKVDKVTTAIAKQAFPLDTLPDTAFSADGLTELQGSYQFLVEQKRLKNPFDVKSWLASS